MGCYLLDTNIVMFLLMGERGCVSQDVAVLLEDYGNRLCTSSVSAMEFVLLHRLGRISPKRYRTAGAMVRAAEVDFCIDILPFGREAVRTLADLEVVPGHRPRGTGNFRPRGRNLHQLQHERTCGKIPHRKVHLCDHIRLPSRQRNVRGKNGPAGAGQPNGQ